MKGTYRKYERAFCIVCIPFHDIGVAADPVIGRGGRSHPLEVCAESQLLHKAGTVLRALQLCQQRGERKAHVCQRVWPAGAAEHKARQRFGVCGCIQPGKKAAHTVPQQNKWYTWPTLAGEAVHAVQVLQHKFAAIPGGKIAVHPVFPAGSAVAKMVVSAHRIPVFHKKTGEIVIAAHIFTHAVRKLHNGLGRNTRLLVKIPGHAVQTACGIKPDGAFLYFRHVLTPPAPSQCDTVPHRN